MEQEVTPARRALYRMMTTIPHRDLTEAVGLFRQAIESDPHMVSRACVYLNMPQSKFGVRDIMQVAIITLLQTPTTAPYWRGFREAGQCLLLGSDVYPDIVGVDGEIVGLDPFLRFRVIDYIRRSDRRIPRRMAAIVMDYFRFLEQNPARLDGVAVHNRRTMHDIWVHYNIRTRAKANELDRVHQMLFGAPPADSRLAQMQAISKMTDSVEQAKAIIAARIPYRVASGLLRKWTPETGIALIQAMSPAEALNSRQWVERSGLLNIPEVREVYENIIARSRSVASMDHRASAQGTDAGVQAAVEQAAERVVEEEPIAGDVLLLVDKSGSMTRAIEVSRELLYHISRRITGQVMVVAFDAYAREILLGDVMSKSVVRRAFSQLTPGGATNAGAALRLALDEGFQPDKVVVVTDTGENRTPYLGDVASSMGEPIPFIVIVVPGSNRAPMVSRLENAGIHVDTFDVTGEDYYVFDQVAALLAGERRKTIVETVLGTPLPYRESRAGSL